MRKLHGIVAGLVFVTVACNGADVVGPTTQVIEAKCQTTFPPPPFPPSGKFTQTDTGTCQMAQLGEMSFRSIKEIDPQAGTQVTSELILTHASGDVLLATGSGKNALIGNGQISFSATLNFVGGTGRFAGATGQAEASGTSNLMQRTAAFVIEGEALLSR